jgi:hypothetical protein
VLGHRLIRTPRPPAPCDGVRPLSLLYVTGHDHAQESYVDMGSVEKIAKKLVNSQTSMAGGAAVAAQTACVVSRRS